MTSAIEKQTGQASDDLVDWVSLARTITEGTGVSTGDRVVISLTGIGGYSAALEVVRECHRRGALATVILAAEDFERSALATLEDQLLATPNPLELDALQWATVYLSLRPMDPPPATSSAPPERAAMQRVARGAVSAARWQVDRWCVVRLPTPSWASLAGVPFKTLAAEFSSGVQPPSTAQRQAWNDLCEFLDRGTHVRIQSNDTDLRLATTGRRWVLFAGAANLPDGEVATAPLDTGVDGYITFPGTCYFADTAISDLRLEFSAGRCTRVEARRGAEMARSLIAADGGSGRVGELGIGLNPAMSTLVGDLFHDEKILGTVHIAMGRAYPQCGGTNTSSIHWDIVKDLRGADGNLVVDGVPLIQAGVPQQLLAARS